MLRKPRLLWRRRKLLLQALLVPQPPSCLLARLPEDVLELVALMASQPFRLKWEGQGLLNLSEQAHASALAVFQEVKGLHNP